MTDRTMHTPSDIIHPKVLGDDKKPLPYSFDEWFSGVVLTSPKWYEGETNAICAAKLEMQMALETRFEGVKAGQDRDISDEELAVVAPIARDTSRMIQGPWGPKCAKFVYALISAKKKPAKK